MTSPNGSILKANAEACRIFGYTEEELRQAGRNGVVDTSDPRLSKALEERNRTGKFKGELTLIRKDGTTFPGETSTAVFKDKDGAIGTSMIIRDITERKRAEQEMTSLQEQLRQSQKLEAIGQLAGGVAHDFNNIITAVQGYSHLTLMRMEKDDPLRVNIEQILQASDRATTLTQSLLAFSRKQVNPKPDNLNDIVSGLHKLLLRLIREDIEMMIQCAKEELMIMADPGQIEQVLMNLVTNARDAMPKGGSIMIQADTYTCLRI